MSDSTPTRRRARLAWHTALGSSAVAAVSLALAFVMGASRFGEVIVFLAAGAVLVMLVAAFLALWLWLKARDAESRSAVEKARRTSAESRAPRAPVTESAFSAAQPSS
ncbi:MAG: hypothetical protein ABR499_04135 [Gemmatimonadaceae bacterium]